MTPSPHAVIESSPETTSRTTESSKGHGNERHRLRRQLASPSCFPWFSACSVVKTIFPREDTGRLRDPHSHRSAEVSRVQQARRRRCSVGSCFLLPRQCRVKPPHHLPAERTAPGLRKLTGDDAKRAEELDKAIKTSLEADRWDVAIAKAEELVALRKRVQGPKHFETVDEEWLLRALRRVAPLSKDDRVAYRSARTMTLQAQTLYTQGKFAEAEHALAARRWRSTADYLPTTIHSPRPATTIWR